MNVTAGTIAEPAVTFVFDDAGKLTSVTQNGLTASKAFTDPAGRLKTLTLPNHLAVTYAYDKDSQVTSLSYGSLGTLTYGYDANGRRVSVGGSLANMPTPQPTQSFTYNPDNSLKTVGSSAVTNDNDGNIQCIAGNLCSPNEFSYDERGHLQQWVANPYTVDYSYDALGRRYQKNIGGLSNSCYVYDGLNVVATTACSGAATASYLGGVGLDELFMVNTGTGNESLLRDALNSTIALTDSGGNPVDYTHYDPYGNTTDTVPGSASPFEFTGRENDTTAISAGYYYSNLYFMRGRYYDPQIARFISRDPGGLAGGINMYTYAGDDPVDFGDPTGMDWESGLEGPGDVCAGCVGGFVGAFVAQVAAPLANRPGRDNDVPESYDGSQNGGGQRDPIIRVQSLGEPIPSTTYSFRDFVLPRQGHDEVAFTFGAWGGGTIGFQLGNKGAYFFMGYGYTTKGVGFSATHSNKGVTPGWQTSGNVTFGFSAGGSFTDNGDASRDLGVGFPPGGSLMYYYNFGPW